MRKLFYLGFALVVMMGVGCAVTDYELITDNDQVQNGQGTGIVNTNGKAHIRESSQVALIWADGSFDEMIWFVDQKANGDQTLYTYDNYSTGYPIFHDDLYCNPDWTGCAILIADNPYMGDVDIYDYTHYNPNCKGGRSLTYLTATTRYYGECGRAKLGLTDRIALLNMGRFGKSMGMQGLWFDMNHNNTTITLDNNAGFTTSLPMSGEASAFLTGRKAYLDMSNPMLANSFRAYANFLSTQATHGTLLTLTYNGISMQGHLAGVNEISNASRVLANVNARY